MKPRRATLKHIAAFIWGSGLPHSQAMGLMSRYGYSPYQSWDEYMLEFSRWNREYEEYYREQDNDPD